MIISYFQYKAFESNIFFKISILKVLLFEYILENKNNIFKLCFKKIKKNL